MKINLFGGPGIGKSTVSAILFAELKIAGINVETVHEYAKELVYEGHDLREATKEFQTKIFKEQLRRELLFLNKAEVLISDSPLLLNAYYHGDPKIIEIALRHSTPKDLNVFLSRSVEKFEGRGRSHNHIESVAIDQKMIDFLSKHCNLTKVDGTSKEKADKIFKILMDSYA